MNTKKKVKNYMNNLHSNLFILILHYLTNSFLAMLYLHSNLFILIPNWLTQNAVNLSLFTF